MGRRRQVSDRQITQAAREVFLDRGPKAPVAMVAKKLGVSTATLFQRTGSKQQLMLMALQPEVAVMTGLDRGVQPGEPVREQLAHVLGEINEYLGAVIMGSLTLRAAARADSLPFARPTRALAHASSRPGVAQSSRRRDYGRGADRRPRGSAHSRSHARRTSLEQTAQRIHRIDDRGDVPSAHLGTRKESAPIAGRAVPELGRAVLRHELSPLTAPKRCMHRRSNASRPRTDDATGRSLIRCSRPARTSSPEYRY